MKFETYSIVEGVTFGFLHFNQNILARLGSFRVLHRGIHLAEDAEIVKFLLALEHIALTHGIARGDLKFVLHDVWSGKFSSRNQNPIHKNAGAFVDGKGHIHFVISRGLRRCIESGVGKTVVKVIVQDDVAIVGYSRIGVRLTWAGAEKIQRGHGIVKLRVIANNLERTDHQLRALVDFKRYGNVVLCVLVIIFDLSIHLDL